MTSSSGPTGRTGPLVMGVLNVTPDSFSDGGLWLDAQRAVAHGRQLVAEGADMVDVGGESTRPGADRVSAEVELRRVQPVIAGLVEAGLVVSIDTMRASVAAAAIEAGAQIVNDVSGGLSDPAMAGLIARRGVRYVVMHWRGHSRDMYQHADYRDVVAEVCAELQQRVDALRQAGVDDAQIVLDPGLGFAKTPEHSWTLLAHLDSLQRLGFPLLVGTSRKGFLGLLQPTQDGGPCPPKERDVATAATSLVCAQAGVWAVRVHDVPSTVAAIQVARALQEAG